MPEFDLKIRSRDIETLISKIIENNPEADIDIVKKAYDFASAAHSGQKRLSGEPYIVHPLEVAIILAMLKLDTTTISAALLHDVVEDTGNTLEILKSEFNEDVAQLVDGVTKISTIKSKSKVTAQAEYLRKMLLATIEDIRVIIIKLADKLHNMRTLMFQPPHKQEKISRETLDIYAPIARRLGVTRISSELEDIAFMVLHKEEYDNIRSSLADRKTELDEYFNNIKSILTETFKEFKIETTITSRAKHYFSIFRKMKEQDKTLDEIYDIRGVRIITGELKDCYGILGIIHSLWTPVAARFKDYIAVPKSNMYQSLHTTVIGPEGHPLEIQIRTRDMHATAEMGIAAHWIYKEDEKLAKRIYNDLALLQNIKQEYSEDTSSREFMTDLKMDLYVDEIFVYTPKGKIVKLSKGSTPVDFAFAIHSEVGEHTVGSKVNNKIVPLRISLKSGDIVEIMTSKTGHPSESWLKFVKTTRARYKIRNWLRKNSDKKFKEDKKGGNQKEPKVEKVAKVSIPANEQMKLKKLSGKNRIGLSIDGASNIEIKLSQCCQPIPGDDVVGFITRGRGITIHKKSCPSLKRLSDESERMINLQWEGSENRLYPIKLTVVGLDRKNLLKDVADQISLEKTNILKMEASVKDQNIAEIKFILEVKSNDHLNHIIKKIKKIKNITDAYKVNEKVILR
jgi:GTP diphosphokinase / guanosine-3',5'-bis(diphosphate) 3'-diphosphatase